MTPFRREDSPSCHVCGCALVQIYPGCGHRLHDTAPDCVEALGRRLDLLESMLADVVHVRVDCTAAAASVCHDERGRVLSLGEALQLLPHETGNARKPCACTMHVVGG